MATMILVLITLYAWWAPTSWLGRTLNAAIAAGLERLGSIRPSTILCFALVVATFAGLIVYGKVEGVMVSALAAPAPETFAVFMAIDVGMAVEVLAVAWLSARSANLTGVVNRLRSAGCALARRTSRRPRARNPKTRSDRPKAANDDGPARAPVEPTARAA